MYSNIAAHKSPALSPLKILQNGRYLPLHCSAAAESSFTLYIDVYSLPIFSGHIIKLLSCWLIFLAVVHTSLSEPYQILTRASSTYDAVPDPTIVVDNAGRITQVNKAAEDLAGLSREDLLEKDCHEVFHPRDMEKALCVVCNSIKSARTIKNVELAFPENGRYYDVTLTPFEYQQDIKGMVHVLHDVTEKKQTEQKLIHNAHYDPLTDFPNRMLAADRLEQAIGHARRFNRHTAVLFIDLDNFKRSASGFCVRFVVIYILWIKTVLLMNASPSIFPRVRSGVRNLFGN